MDTTENPSIVEDDDVEAHGLKEVAAGIGVAAVLGGAGAGAALAAQGDAPVGTNQTRAATHAVQNTENAATGVVKHKTPNPPPAASPTNNTKTPTYKPLIKLPKERGVEQSSNDNAVSSTVHKVVKAAQNTADKVDEAAQSEIAKTVHTPRTLPPVES